MERAVLELLSSHPTMALVVSDGEGTIIQTTAALERMLGTTPPRTIKEAEALGLRDSTGLRPLGLAELPMMRALRGETVIDQVLMLHTSEGRLLYLRCNAGPLRHPNGTVRGSLTLVQDVTAEWLAATMQHELRDRLVTTVNHELRTPLAKIVGHSELLVEAAEDGHLSEPFDRSIAAIARAGGDLADLAERLTHLADLDAATRIQPAPTDVVDLMRSSVDSEAEAARERGVKIKIAGPPRLLATIDGRLVSQAVRELLNNAVGHSPARSTVALGLSRMDGRFEIRVADRGPGIPALERERLIQPFERGVRPAGAMSSPGLGLAIASAVAAAHGGAVALDDNKPRGLVARMDLKRNIAA